ncbi:hypothetical protein CCR91_11145 [Thiorhodovibrio winogradskyi]|nr:hypothetical protein [Thiorhodovibrio winogradskyi]
MRVPKKRIRSGSADKGMEVMAGRAGAVIYAGFGHWRLASCGGAMAAVDWNGKSDMACPMDAERTLAMG